ncbi:MAG: hypothetical protein LBH48_00665 [Bifidobacteriaceae bacterium]|jgi:hypothetical protein|nr:hypothetical protein [Bifidobacteriaceae bacterium]
MAQAVMFNLTRKGRRHHGERGSAMMATLVGLTVMAMMLGVALTLTAKSTKFSRHTQDVDRATAAAEAGVADLLTELRINPDYLDDVTATKNKPTGYCNKPATGGPKAEGDVFASTCNWSAAMEPRWDQLLGSDGERPQEYHYAVTQYDVPTQWVEVVSTGRSGDVYRSVRTTLARETTQQWGYFADYALADPIDPAVYNNTNGLYAPYLTSEECGGNWALGADLPNLGYFWETKQLDPTNPKPRRTYQLFEGSPRLDCRFGWWSSSYSFSGPVHSNDTFFGAGATINGKFTVSDPRCKESDAEDPSTWWHCSVAHSNGNGALNFIGPAPVYREPLQMPTVADAKTKARAGLGCLYQGATRIVLNGDMMTVWSKDTKEDRPGCGSPAQLATAEGAKVKVPIDSLIFVDAATGVAPVQIPSGTIDGTAKKPGKLPVGTYKGTEGSGAKYKYEASMTYPNKFAGYGNLWVEGVMTGGNLTIAADRNLIITGDIFGKDRSTDLIGLVGGESVEVFSPAIYTYTGSKSGGQLTWSKSTDYEFAPNWPTEYSSGIDILRLDAAIYSATGGFRVQNFSTPGERGKIVIFGSLAERFQGFQSVMGVPSGYEMDTIYNPRLASARPLLLPPLGNASWTTTWQEKAQTPEVLRSH